MANFPTEDDDIITGTENDDTIDALGGNDIVFGGDGNDRLFGGDDDDKLYGENGDDLLIGNRGDDKMIGGWGDDVMVWNNGDGSDLMEGGHDYDTAVVNGSDSDVEGDEFVIAPNGDRVAARPRQPRPLLARHRHHREARGQRSGRRRQDHCRLWPQVPDQA